MGIGKTPLQTQKQKVRLPVLQENLSRGYGGSLDQLYINCYPERNKNPATGEERVVLTKRSGAIYLTGGPNITYDIATSAGLTYTNMVCRANICINQLSDIFVAIWVDVSTSIGYVVQYRAFQAVNSCLLIGTIPKLNPPNLATGFATADYFCVNEVSISSGGTLYAGITVTRTSVDRSASKSYYAIAGATAFTATTLVDASAGVANFPDSAGVGKVVVGNIIQMNGYFYVMTTDGGIYNNSVGNDITTWNALGVIQTYQDSDGGQGLIRFKHHILAMGTNSIEFFNDVGNNPAAGSTLERTEQALIRFGVLHPKSYIAVEDNIWWISGGVNSTHSVWKLDGYTPVKVSTPREDKSLWVNRVSMNGLSDINMFSYYQKGKLHIGINGIYTLSMNYANAALKWGDSTDTWYSTDKIMDSLYFTPGTMMYDIQDNTWWWMMFHQGVNSEAGLTRQLYPVLSTRAERASDYTTGYYDQLVFISSSVYYALSGGITGLSPMSVCEMPGRTRQWSSGAYYDSNDQWTTTSTPVTCLVQFNQADFGTGERKRINSVECIFQSTPQDYNQTSGASSNVESGSFSYTLMMLRANHMNWNTTSDHTNIIKRCQKTPQGSGTGTAATLHGSGYNDRWIVMNLGMGRTFNFAVLCQSKDPFPLEAIEIDVQEGTH
jgi:hypothetical protein